MNRKKFLVTFLVILTASTLTGFLVHGLLLRPDYQSVAQLNRPMEEQQDRFPFLLLANLSFALAFAAIYCRGVQDKPWLGQGVRFGALAWLFVSVPTYLTYYMAQPWPGSLVVKQIGFDGGTMILLGVVAAAINRK